MANPLNDIARALGSLSLLPDIGRQLRRMAGDVRLMREGVQALPEELARLRESVDSLHEDMNKMVDDVAELKHLEGQIDGLRTDLQRLPFMGGRRRGGLPPTGTPPAAAGQ